MIAILDGKFASLRCRGEEDDQHLVKAANNCTKIARDFSEVH
jgi:hypothetical protein